MPWYNTITGEHVYSPSDYDKQDELVYKPSIYAKEELPTWAEIYEEFYIGKQYSYNQYDEEDQKLDLYWKVPHKKFLISVVCNQFNKMIFEDELKDRIINELNFKIPGDKVVGIHFKYGTMDDMYFNLLDYKKYWNKVFDIAPDIYTIPMPNGKPNPFITSNHSRININNIKDPNRIYPILQVKNSKDSDGYAIYSPNMNNEDFNTVIEIMMKQYIDYFTGEIGWKDSNNEIITCSNNCRGCTEAGHCAK